MKSFFFIKHNFKFTREGMQLIILNQDKEIKELCDMNVRLIGEKGELIEKLDVISESEPDEFFTIPRAHVRQGEFF